MYSYFNKNNFFYKLQFGFRKNYGTNHAVTKLVETITDAFKQKEFVVGVFLNLSKAFDTINYNILFSKLHYYGIRGCALNWFQSYLSNRLQQVEYRGNLSSSCYLSHGVPQGSILGPLLFLIYVKNFQNCLQKGKALMFVDDTTIFFQHKYLSELTLTANTHLENVNKWLIANKLSLNITKTNYIIFQTPRCKQSTKQLNIILKNHALQRVSDTKFLGVIIHEHLSWKPHMEYLLKKITSSIYCIKKIKPFLDQKILLFLYHTLVKSHILYCITSWCFGNETMINKLQCAVNKLMRSILNVGKRQTVSYVMKDNSLLTIRQIRDIEIAIFVYKFMNKLLPLPFDHSFKTAFKITKNTRSQSSLYPSFCRVHITKQAIRYTGPLIWNDIPLFGMIFHLIFDKILNH